MDLYPKNPTIIKKLLAKRQNPVTQILNSQNPSLPNKNINPQNIFQKANLGIFPTTTTPAFTQPVQHQVQFNSEAIIIVTTKDTCNSSTDQSSSAEGETTGSEDGGSGDHRPPRKKIKLNPEIQEKKRRISFEDEIDKSTTCETYSDGHNELSDYSSPSFGYQSHRESRFEEFRLDDEDDGSCNHSFRLDTMSNASEEDSIYMKEAQERAFKFEGKCLSTRCCSDKIPIKMMCKYKHTWEAPLEELRDKWCPKCDQNLKSLMDFARQNGGYIKNSMYEDIILFECSRRHQWSAFHKNAKKKWCSECAKEDKAEMRRKFEQERLQKQKEDEELQKRLFEEARRKASQESAGASFRQNIPAASQISMLEYYRRMDFEIEKLAQKYTTDFMNSKEFSGQCSYQQILQVYKILIMPDEILKTYMMNLMSDALKAEFRRLAKLIHPDKNKHPKAGLAFQKIYKTYEATIDRCDGSFSAATI